MCPDWDSNPGKLRPKFCALPTKLATHFVRMNLLILCHRPQEGIFAKNFLLIYVKYLYFYQTCFVHWNYQGFYTINSVTLQKRFCKKVQKPALQFFKKNFNSSCCYCTIVSVLLQERIYCGISQFHNHYPIWTLRMWQ